MSLENSITNTDLLIERINQLELENQNLKNEIQQMKCDAKYNKGEKAEIICVKKLLKMALEKNYKSLVKIFGSEAKQGIKIFDLESGKECNDIDEINKTGSKHKSDVCILMIKSGRKYYASIKSYTGSLPTILNHTHRNAYCFQKGLLKKELSKLDKFVSKYIEERNSKRIGEDVKLSELEITDNKVKNSFIKMLSYFIFKGTGRGPSKSKSNSILEYGKDEKIKFIKCNTRDKRKEYATEIYDKCVVSLRNKAMPKSINDNHKPWIYRDNGKEKGCLHVRLHNA